MLAIEKLQAAQMRIASHYLKKLRQINEAYRRGDENTLYASESFDADNDQIEHWLLWLEEHANNENDIANVFNDFVCAGQQIFAQRFAPDRCLTLHKQALEIARSLNNLDAVLTHLSAIAAAYMRLSDNANMHHYLLQMYDIAKLSNNQEKLAECLYLLSHPYRDFGQYLKAIDTATESLNLYRHLHDARNIARCLIRLGRITMFKGDWQRAESYLQEASVIVEQHNYQEFLMQIIENFYELHYKMGNFDEALSYNQKALEIASQLGQQEMIIKNLLSFGILYTCKREFSTANDYFQQALDATYETGILSQESSIIANMGYANYLSGDYDVALQNFEKARQMYHAEQTKLLECLEPVLDK